MATRKKTVSIAREEWDFCKESVPDESLGACLLYEYAREKLNRSPKLRRIFNECCNPGIDIPSYIRLAPYFSGDYGGSIIQPDMLSMPWLKSTFTKLKDEEQKLLGIKQKEKPKAAFFREEEFYHAMDFPIGLSAIDHFKWIAPFLMKSVNRTEPEERDLRHGYFCIDLNMADKPIVEQFSKWLTSYRKKMSQGGKRNAMNDGTGKSFTAIQQRTLLKQLGATRLMESGRTAEEAMNYSADKSKNNEAIYSDTKQWSI